MYTTVGITQETSNKRVEQVMALQKTLMQRGLRPFSNLHLYGSSISCIGSSDTSDLDICFITKKNAIDLYLKLRLEKKELVIVQYVLKINIAKKPFRE